MKLTRVHILFYFLFSLGHPLLAQQARTIIISDQRINLLPNVNYYLDPNGLGIDSVQKLGVFMPLPDEKIQFGFTNSTLWLTFKIYNGTEISLEKILDIGMKDLDYVDLFEFRESKLISTKISGDMRSVSVSNMDNFFPAFRTKLPPQSTSTYYVKIKSASSLYCTLTIWDEIAYLRFLALQDKLLWLFIGIQMVRLLFNIILSRFIREKAFNYYTLVIGLLCTGIIINSMNLKSALGPVGLNLAVNLEMYLIPMGLVLAVYHILLQHPVSTKVKSIIFVLGISGLLGVILNFFLFDRYEFVFITSLYLEITLLILFILCVYQVFYISQSRFEYLIPVLFLLFNQSLYVMIALNLLSFSLLTLVLISAFFSLEVFTMPIVIGILLKKSYLRLQESIKTLYDTRNKLTADLHDEIGSILTQIAIESDMIKNNLYTAEQKDSALNSISSKSRDVIHSLSDIVWSINTKNDQVINLIDRMQDHAAVIFRSFPVDFQFITSDIHLQRNISTSTRQEIFNIYKEAIHNIVKHSRATMVKVKFELNENNFTLYIENDSPKVAPGTVLGGNGNQIMKDRAKKISAVIEWESTPDFYLVVLKGKM